MVLSNRLGMRLRIKDLSVTLGSQRVLEKIDLDIKAGERIAIVGTSGAGKSTLLACILGLTEHAAGEITIDGIPQREFDIGRLRRETVWVDPTVQLWNRSALHNLHFGNPRAARNPVHRALEQLELKDLLERMPTGLATKLGESGSRVSGGEGQRIRIARALLRRGARLVLLDEAFRGLERPLRRRFSRTVRENLPGATILEVTHDTSDTVEFDRVLVVENGVLVEEGAPAALLAQPDSRYAALVEADRHVQSDIWSGPGWKRFVVPGDGRIETVEGDP